MKRRDFLKKSLLGLGAAATASTMDAKKTTSKTETVKTRVKVENYVSEPARQIPVVAHADIVIVGGGPSGVAAALSASREGASVILLEKFTYLGGLWTGGMVLPILDTNGVPPSGTRQEVIRGVKTDIVNRIKELNMAWGINPGQDPHTDPEASKYVVAEMLHEAGVQVIYLAQAAQVTCSGDRIESVIVETKSGRVAIQGKFFIDCSGDGDIFYWAGEKFSEQKHHIGVMWRIGNAENAKHIGKTVHKGVRLMHTNGQMDQDGLDMFNLSRLQYEMRKYMWDKTQEVRKQEGCQDVFLLDTPSQLSVRATRSLDALHIVTMDDSMKYTTYSDVIGMSGGSAGFTYKGQKYKGKNRPAWQIPYRSLVPKKNHNLLVAGRCFGYDQALTYDAREIGTCFVTGQASGIAAAMAVSQRYSAKDVEISILQQKLRAQGALLEW